MKTITSIALVSFLVLSGMALAAQSGEQEQRSSSPMMQEMMKGGKEGEHMDGMMRMMKMMDQCSAMMDSSEAKAGKTEQGQQK